MRMLVYAAAFAAGMCWFEHSRARKLLVGTLATATAAGCLVGVVRMVVSQTPLDLFAGYRLDDPVGYVNGLASVAALGCLLCIAAASLELDTARHRRVLTTWRPSGRYSEGVARPTRGGFPIACFTAGASLCLGTLLLTQSRAGLTSLAVGTLLMVLIGPARAQLAAFTAVAVVPVLVIGRLLLDPFRRIGEWTRSTWEAANPSTPALRAEAIESVRLAGEVLLGAATIAGLLAGIYTALLLRRRTETYDRHLPPPPPTVPAANIPNRSPGHSLLPTSRRMQGIMVGVGMMLALLASLALPGGGPAGWGADLVRGCIDPRSQDSTSGALTSTSHFSDMGGMRCDFWRVALADAGAHPIRGIGADNFGDRYAQVGRSQETPDHAHSVVMSLVGELGLVGLMLGGVLGAASIVGAWTFIRTARRAAAAEVAAAAAIVMWFMHANTDWLWQLPASTVPALLIAGSLARGSAPRGTRMPAPVATLAPLALTAAAVAVIIAPAMTDRHLRASEDALQRAQSLQAQPPRSRLLDSAASHAVRARQLAPNAAAPWVMTSRVYLLEGNRAAAERAIARAQEIEPRTREVRAQRTMVDTSRRVPSQ
jgi:hypothetical protein